MRAGDGAGQEPDDQVGHTFPPVTIPSTGS